MSESLFINIPQADRAICPKHGDVGVWPGESFIDEAPAIWITLSGLEGKHCLRCWADWIRVNIPELKRQTGKVEVQQ